MSAKILLLDIETTPSLAYVWGLHQENIPLDRLIRPGRILCWAAKWYKEKEIHFGAEWDNDGNLFIDRLWQLMLNADAIVTYNGNKFDLPKINGEILKRKLPPLPPTPSIDLYSTCRRLGYPSGKLAFVTRHLGLGGKAQHAGFDTWVGAMEGIEADRRVMERYNKQDVRLLERLYTTIRPYIKNHPHLSGCEGRARCPVCDSARVQRRGSRRTRTTLVERLNCQGCGHWFSGKATRIKIEQ
jgi:hypothetical protein